MKTGKCPKCGGENIYTNKGYNAHYGERAHVNVSAFGAVRTEIYICSDCRYIEEYVAEFEKIDKVIEKFKKIAQ